ncbi:hypothetical protein [Bradyrhizobium icense]|uniref:hypothetical protein n=1 Tax=Bradyrhizobium icense TaxID=1274631 RepID=UPI0012E99594|nr:hypothetical protein [Bradyrhizobium icense]
MRYVSDRCLVCGSPDKTNTTCAISDFWFCSSEHYSQAVETYVPKEYKKGTSQFDDPRIRELWDEAGQNADDNYEEYIRLYNLDWTLEQYVYHCLDHTPYNQLVTQRKNSRDAAWEAARQKLTSRLESEARVQRDEKREKERMVREKEEEKERIVREKEEDRQRKLQQEEDEREAEEERWRPKPFEL